MPAEIRLYDRLFTVPNPAAADDFTQSVNPESLIVMNGFVEPSLVDAEAEKGFSLSEWATSVPMLSTQNPKLWCLTALLV